jgi:cell division protein FtsI/penicillin-binding protein 2
LTVTALHVSRFLQAVGNDGVMLVPTAREEQSTRIAMNSSPSHRDLKKSTRVMRESTALRLQSAMRDTVKRGTAKSIANVFANTAWQICGKTGTGPALMPKRSEPDGWFAGLIFDAQGRARFTVATFVRSAGAGGGNAAKVSAALAKYVVGAETSRLRRSF